ncbi:hypothetical protein [Fundidesulfovibrio terrae]|uniref:hypothetical protein n=1 Tax=Fundidesulfovibrio terrae TaxID=2922866 RepID=UPI001FAEFACA|nr:hypothetical protein [Fundidesulfovibrio terrae]
MKTAAFVLFAVVTAAAAALSTLVATRYLALEKDLSETRSQLEDVLRERKRQEEEKMSIRLEAQRVQSELEARFSEQRSQLEECGNQRQRDFQELLTGVNALQKRLTDMEVQLSPSAKAGDGKPQGEDAASRAGDGPPPAKTVREPQPAKNTDVPKGAIPTPEQEARKLEQAQ